MKKNLLKYFYTFLILFATHLVNAQVTGGLIGSEISGTVYTGASSGIFDITFTMVTGRSVICPSTNSAILHPINLEQDFFFQKMRNY